MATVAQDAVGLHGASQDDWELGRLVELVGQAIAGELVVEIGCDRGGTLWLWRELGAHVVAVTLHTRQDRQFNAHGAAVIVGDSTDLEVRATVERFIEGRNVALVFVVGGHVFVWAFIVIGWALDLAAWGLVVVDEF